MESRQMQQSGQSIDRLSKKKIAMILSAIREWEPERDFILETINDIFEDVAPNKKKLKAKLNRNPKYILGEMPLDEFLLEEFDITLKKRLKKEEEQLIAQAIKDRLIELIDEGEFDRFFPESKSPIDIFFEKWNPINDNMVIRALKETESKKNREALDVIKKMAKNMGITKFMQDFDLFQEELGRQIKQNNRQIADVPDRLVGFMAINKIGEMKL